MSAAWTTYVRYGCLSRETASVSFEGRNAGPKAMESHVSETTHRKGHARFLSFHRKQMHLISLVWSGGALSAVKGQVLSARATVVTPFCGGGTTLAEEPSEVAP